MRYSKEHCMEMLDLYSKAEKAVLTGKRYRIGTRELERENLVEIRKGRMFWEAELDASENKGKRKLARRVIPRDF